jgi:hypothetical protein
MACSATGLDDDSPANAPVTTTESMKYTGTDVPSFFRDIPIVTDSKYLLTFTPGAFSKTLHGGEFIQTETPSASKTHYQAQASATPTSLDPLVFDTSMESTPTHTATSVSPAATTTSSAGSRSVAANGFLFVGLGMAFSLLAGIWS